MQIEVRVDAAEGGEGTRAVGASLETRARGAQQSERVSEVWQAEEQQRGRVCSQQGATAGNGLEINSGQLKKQINISPPLHQNLFSVTLNRKFPVL